MSKKDDIIKTALNLFNSYSYNSIGVDRIISESGVAKMTFYKYFPSKAKLIEECLNRRNMNLQESLNASIEKCNATDCLDHIKTIFFWYHAWFHSPDFNGCMFQKAVEEVSKIYPSTIYPAIEYKNWLTERIRIALEGLGIAVKQSLQLASMLVSILDGMTMQAQIDQDSVHIDEYWKRISRLIQFELTDI
ncbi:TetR/AcrR family transcriptional regulator [Acinetobacter sp. ANC 4648]|uniref:TetR/AcrR family transcriptional regulator n=1 Tax=Acinetobacter sp. ANC 4648 TaxID=1977875 RepID=UPI000A349624|nr:TetR/AcrR family transcriptional regulator [Acinetobacter sp. ANC 4648]OTG81660.1 TetR family transcriptional regulator [Acinetobacter sp. ANC 4648]